MSNIGFKLYAPSHTADFFRDYTWITNAIKSWRSSLRGRGWAVPDAEQERLLGILVLRCQKYLHSNTNHKFIPGYICKCLSRYVEELADELNYKYKMTVQRSMLSPENRAALDAVLLQSCLTSIRLRWREKDSSSTPPSA